MRRCFIATAFFAIAYSSLAADAPSDSPEQKVLDRWAGKWRAEYKLLKTEWTPEEQSGTEEWVASRVLGGKFIQVKVERSDKTNNMLMYNWDPQKNTYRNWWFSSTGLTAESTGKWDESGKTMIWTSVGQPNFTTTVTSHFIDDDHAEWNVKVTDPTGKLLYHTEGTSTRVNEAAKPER